MGVWGRRLKAVAKWTAIVIVTIVVVALIGGALYEQYARRDAAKRFPPRGRMVDIGGRRIHLDCRGSGSPTVILESGLDINGTLAWYKVQDAIAKTTRVCSSDRAGIMWSDAPPHAQDGDHAARDLHAALAGAGIDGPLVLLGHSLGGPYIMNYTRQFGGNVKGLVFVDASHPDQIAKMTLPGKRPESPELPLILRVMGKLSWTGLSRLLPVQGTPDEPKAITDMRQAYLGHSMQGAIAEMTALPTIFAQGGKLRALGDRPIVVLTAMKPNSPEELQAQGLTPAEGLAHQKLWQGLHDDEASWSTRSRHQLVPDAGHYIQLERPDVVLRAVSDVVAAVRADAAT
jgi:pimeloyl-ACP methyl ester carboxylesterase